MFNINYTCNYVNHRQSVLASAFIVYKTHEITLWFKRTVSFSNIHFMAHKMTSCPNGLWVGTPQRYIAIDNVIIIDAHWWYPLLTEEIEAVVSYFYVITTTKNKCSTHSVAVETNQKWQLVRARHWTIKWWSINRILLI